MWSVTQMCRCLHPLRTAQTKLLGPNVRNSLNASNVVARQLMTPAQYTKSGFNSFKGLKLKDIIKSNGILVRLCSSAPKPTEKTSKVVGYWLLGCSGMVFTAVILGMVSGYLILLYSVYFVVRVAVNASKGK